MNYTRILFAMVASVIVASCTTTPNDYNWCKIYSFADDDQGFTIGAGSQVADVGLLSDGTGLLQFEFAYSMLVTPLKVVFQVARPDGVTGDINATASGTIYGVSSSFSSTLPAALNIATLEFFPTNAGDSSSLINVTVDANQPIAISYFIIYGNGASPFPGDNPCDDSTPTPPIPDPPTSTAPPSPTPEPNTPTGTATLTPIPSATSTPSITPTPQPSWCATFAWQYEWDFSVSNGGFAPYQNFGQSPSGLYYTGQFWGASTTNYALISIRRTGMSFVAQQIEAVISDNTNVRSSVNDQIGIGVSSGGTSPPFSSTQIVWTNSADFNQTNRVVTATNLGNTTPSNSVFVYSSSTPIAFNTVSAIRIRGTGALPSSIGGGTLTQCNPPTPTPTNTSPPTATNTPAPTNTIAPTSTSTSTATRTPIATSTGVPATRTPLSVASPTPRPTNTPVPTATLAASLTPLPTATLIPSATRFATATRTPIPIVSNTPAPTVGPGTPTLEPPPSITPVATDTGPDQVDENAAEWEILDVLLAFFNFVANAIGSLFQFLASLVSFLLGAIANIIAAILSLLAAIPAILGSIFDFLRELWDIGRLLIEIILGLLGLLIAYIGQFMARLTALVSAFFTATPTPIPGLPQCVTAPLQSDLCAVYYIMDWTIFAPNTPGAIIIPLIMTIVNVYIIVQFVRYVLKILRRGESVTDVG